MNLSLFNWYIFRIMSNNESEVKLYSFMMIFGKNLHAIGIRGPEFLLKYKSVSKWQYRKPQESMQFAENLLVILSCPEAWWYPRWPLDLPPPLAGRRRKASSRPDWSPPTDPVPLQPDTPEVLFQGDIKRKLVSYGVTRNYCSFIERHRPHKILTLSGVYKIFCNVYLSHSTPTWISFPVRKLF